MGMASAMGWGEGRGTLPAASFGHRCHPGEAPDQRCFALLGAVARESERSLAVLPGRSWNGIPSVPRGFLPVPADNVPVVTLSSSRFGSIFPDLSARKCHYLDPARTTYHGVEFDVFSLTWRRTRFDQGRITMTIPCALFDDQIDFTVFEKYLKDFLPIL